MKIKIDSLRDDWSHNGWLIEESESGFYAYLSETKQVQFKFPWKLYNYTPLEEK